MNFDFDEPVSRKGTGSAKWDAGALLKQMGVTDYVDENTLPLFTADMDFRCPPSVREAVQKVTDFNLYGYTVVHPALYPAYYEAVTGWFQRRHGWRVKPEEVLYAEGTISAIKNAVLAFSKPGDGILINRPVYTPFTTVIESTGRKVVNSPLINTDGYYTVDFDDLEKKAAQPSTVCMILCSPHNPTGRIWTDRELLRIYEICRANRVLLIADEIHGDLIRRDQVFHPLGALTDGQGLISCTAANKTFNLAGLKCSNAVITDPELRRRYSEQTGLLFPSPVTLAATVGAYNGGEEWLEQLKGYLDSTFDWVLAFTKENLPQMRCLRPEGTYILWMDFQGCGLSPAEIHNRIYRQANVVLEGGAQFDPERGAGFERICLGTRLSLVQEAFTRIARQF